MTWLKYAGASIVGTRWIDRTQDQELTTYAKPRGFWITDDAAEDCWKAWCVAEDFYLENLSHRHEVDLDESRILILRNECDMQAFADEFLVGTDRRARWLDRAIDWPRVAQRHAGIIITPYQWGLRLERDFNWYYPWDCTGGCIWEAAAIKDVRLVAVDLAMKDGERAKLRAERLAEKDAQRDQPDKDGGEKQGERDDLVGAEKVDEAFHGLIRLQSGEQANFKILKKG